MIDRRDFLKLCAAGGAAGLLRAAVGETLRVEFAVEDAALARALPPGFEAADPARVRVEWSNDAAWFLARARSGQQEGWFVLRGWTAEERKLRVAREALGLPVFPGEASFDGTTAEVRADGRTLIRATVGEASGAEGAAEETLLALDFRAAPDWTTEPVAEEGAVVSVRRPAAGEWTTVAVRSFDLPEATADHPTVELVPVGEVRAQRGAAVEPPSEIVEERPVDAPATALPLRYGRPKSDERTWTPPGWRGDVSAWSLTDDELARFREREKLRLRPIQLVEVDAMISQEAHRALLPPPCGAAGRPMIKIVGLRSDGADVSAQPFSEAWLLAFTIVANRPAWYAVSHIQSGGDEVLGREAWGYPTKRGAPETVVTPFDFSLTVQRLGREIVYAAGAVQGFSTGTTLLQNGVVGLRASRGGRSAELIYQHWHYQGLRRRVDPKSLVLELPSKTAEGAGAATDPWFELGPVRPYAAMVIDGGGMQRSAGERLMGVEGFEPYYRERGDGLAPWEGRPDEAPTPKLLIEAPASRS